MAYATVQDVQDGMLKTMTEREREVCATLLDRAAVIIDAVALDAPEEAKKTVSCMIVERALSSGAGDIPLGATQVSRGGLGYTESWSISGGSVGQLYLSKTERKLLGIANQIDSHSPVEDIVKEATPW